jgi:hypothetical protein
MRHDSGPDYTATGTFDNVVLPRRCTMVNDLREHPDDWTAMFRPRGCSHEYVAVVWNYDASFESNNESTAVRDVMTYPR